MLFDILHFLSLLLWAAIIIPLLVLVSTKSIFYIKGSSCMQWLIMNMILLNTVPDGKPLRIHTLTGDALFAVWLPSLHNICRPSISLALSMCILTWIIPHGLNIISTTPHSIFSVGPGNPCRLSEINPSYVHFCAADSLRPFPLCVLLAFPVPCFACPCSLCCISPALKMV